MKVEQAPGNVPEDIKKGEKALILHTQRLSTEDGPGIRTTVFFKGCPLRCSWCHNPEGISPSRQVHWLESRCIGCGICLKACPYGCLFKTEKGIARDRSRCKVCGKCAEECPSGAQEILGREVTVEGLLAELLKDKIYYEKSGGGVTLSGGEPLMQPDFVLNLLRRLKESGISTAIDTCGVCPSATIQSVLPYTDLVLYDLKGIDPVAHKQHTGLHNEGILKNLLIVREYISAHPGSVRLWIRTPLIPGATAARDTIQGVGRFIHDNLGGAVQRWELCAFNNLCRDKYRRLDMEWQYAAVPLFSRQELAEFEQIAKSSGPDPAVIFVTGVSRVES